MLNCELFFMIQKKLLFFNSITAYIIQRPGKRAHKQSRAPWAAPRPRCSAMTRGGNMMEADG